MYHAPATTHEQRYAMAACSGKKAHASKGAAHMWLKKNCRPWWDAQTVYRCSTCGQWHTAKAGKR